MKIRSIMRGKEANVGNQERVVSLFGGALMMYRALTKGKIFNGIAGGYLLYRGATGYCPIYSSTGKDTTGKTQNINIKTHVSVNRPVSEVYQFWRQLDNLPLFMHHLENVKILDEKTSEWKARVPAGMGAIQWTSEIVEDEPNDRIGWRSLPESSIENAGNVHFRDAGKFGTNVYAVISYQAPAGKAGEGLGRLFNPTFEQMVKEDLQNLKRYLEGNEVSNVKEVSWQE